MLQKRKRWIIALFTFLTLFTITTSAMADDHDAHDDDDEKYEYYQKSDDNDDEEGWETEQHAPIGNQAQSEYWNIWSHEPGNNPNNSLPITSPSEAKVSFNGKETSLFVIPQDGQLLISAESFANELGANMKYYPQSKIAVLKNENTELIVRSDSNAAFENKLKTPMPTKAIAYEKSIYIPVSVGANAFGYRVSWDNQRSALIIKSIK